MLYKGDGYVKCTWHVKLGNWKRFFNKNRCLFENIIAFKIECPTCADISGSWKTMLLIFRYCSKRRYLQLSSELKCKTNKTLKSSAHYSRNLEDNWTFGRWYVLLISKRNSNTTCSRRVLNPTATNKNSSQSERRHTLPLHNRQSTKCLMFATDAHKETATEEVTITPRAAKRAATRSWAN